MADPIGWVVVERRGDDTIVKIHGEVDVSNAADVEKKLEESLESGTTRHVIDLSNTTYFDSTGIRILFSLATRLKSRRMELHVVVPPKGLTRRVLELTGLPLIVTLHSSLAEVPPGNGPSS